MQVHFSLPGNEDVNWSRQLPQAHPISSIFSRGRAQLFKCFPKGTFQTFFWKCLKPLAGKGGCIGSRRARSHGAELPAPANRMSRKKQGREAAPAPGAASVQHLLNSLGPGTSCFYSWFLYVPLLSVCNALFYDGRHKPGKNTFITSCPTCKNYPKIIIFMHKRKTLRKESEERR